MKILLIALAAIISVSASAASTKKNIRLVRANQARTLDVTDTYFGPIAVGRISAQTWQVELVGLTVEDPNSTTTPKRKVKAVLDISPTDPMDNNTVEVAKQLLYFLYSTKTGFQVDNDSLSDRPVAKVTSISFNDADVTVSTTNCMGLDLEVANQTTPATKECYRVRPLEIYEHAL